jgi:hypothetical protein
MATTKKAKTKAVPLHAAKTLGGERRYSSCSFTTSALDGVNSQRHAPAALYPPEKDPRYPLYRRLGGTRAGLDTEVRGKILSPLQEIEPRSPGRPVRIQTLYWLCYPAHNGSDYM